MKQRFSILFLATAVAGIFASCNNGNYDANPDFNAGEIQNPVNPALPAAKGTLKVRVNGQLKTFPFAYFTNNTVNNETVRGVIGSLVGSDSVVETIVFYVGPYKGIKTYPVTDTTFTFGQYQRFRMSDTTLLDDFVSDTSTVAGEPRYAPGEVKVEASSADDVRGTFRFSLYKRFPERSKTETVELTDGTFFVGKQ